MSQKVEVAGQACAKKRRQPSQSRGEHRVNLIIDAFERLLVASGDGAITMHKLAAEAQTSVGSLYHFFCDKQNVLVASYERHERAMAEVLAAIDSTGDDVWRTDSAEQLIGRLIIPFLDYVSRNPVVLQLMRLDRVAGKSPTDTPIHPLIQALCLRILTLRLPSATDADRRAYTATLLGLPVGLVVDLIAEYDDELRSLVLHREIPRALVAYLESIEVQQG